MDFEKMTDIAIVDLPINRDGRGFNYGFTQKSIKKIIQYMEKVKRKKHKYVVVTSSATFSLFGLKIEANDKDIQCLGFTNKEGVNDREYLGTIDPY